MIDHRRGCGNTDRKRSLPFTLVIDGSARFHQYDDILINNDWAFYTTPVPRPLSPEPVSHKDFMSDDYAMPRQERRLRPHIPVYETNNPPNAGPSAPVVRELTEHQMLLLCPDSLAYALRRKEWSEVPLDSIP